MNILLPSFEENPFKLLKYVHAVIKILNTVCPQNNFFMELNKKRLLKKVLKRMQLIDELLCYLERNIRMYSRSITTDQQIGQHNN